MINLVKSTFYQENKTKNALIKFIKKQKYLSMGAECNKFEQNFATKHDRLYGVMVSSGSSANLVLIQALLNLNYLKKGERIGISALTWATNVMPLIQLGLKPIVLDVAKENLNVTPKILTTSIKKIQGLFLTNTLGFADNLPKIKKICQRHKILFIEDNCESLGSKINNTLLGNFSLASTFSFFVGHHFSTVEGGIILTDDLKLYEMLLMARAHGWDRNLATATQTALRKQAKVDDFYAKYTFYDLAYNARPTEICGFLANCQLKFLRTIIQKRHKNFMLFHKAILKNPDLLPLNIKHMQKISAFSIPVIVKNKTNFLKYKKLFEKNKIEIRPLVSGNIARQPFFKKYVKEKFNLPNADWLQTNGFYFGNSPEFTKNEMTKILKLLKQ